MGVFALIVIASTIADSLGYSQLGLAWNNNERTKNPIVNIVSIMDIRSSIIYAINHQMDLEEYKKNSLINKTNVNKFYGLNST
jgi:hypothetical protein